jgi:hypothetical protein
VTASFSLDLEGSSKRHLRTQTSAEQEFSSGRAAKTRAAENWRWAGVEVVAGNTRGTIGMVLGRVRTEAVFSSVHAAAVFAMMLVLLGCGDEDQENATVPRDLFVTLERTACFGSCPAYTASVDASGLVQYDGTRCVAVYGPQEARLSQQRLGEVMAALRDVDFFSLQDEYRGDKSYCALGFFDGTVIVTTIRVNGMTKTVRNWHGCNAEDVATRLDAFERRLDDLLGTAQWVPCPTGTLQPPDYSRCSGTPGCQ